MKQTTRPLNMAELGNALQLSVFTHCTINLLDRLSLTNIYKHKLKATAKSFLKEIELHAEENLWKTNVVNSNLDSANSQMQGLVDHLGNLFTLSVATEKLEPEQQLGFWKKVNEAFEEFNIPLELLDDGVLQFREQKVLIEEI